MRNYRKNIDDFFREKLGNYRETPPPEAWEELEVRLDDLTPVVPGSPYRWIWHFAIISLLLVLGISAGKNIMSSSYSSQGTIAANDNTVAPAPNAAPANGTKTTENTVPQNANTVAGNNEANVPAGNESAAGNTPDDNNQNGNTGATVANASNNDHNSTRAGKKASRSRKNASRLNSHPSAFRHEGNSSSTGEKPQEGTIYNSAVSEPGTEPNTNNQSKASPLSALSTDNESAPMPGTGKKADEGKPDKAGDAAKGQLPPASRIGFQRFEAGVKAGYEGGISNSAASKLVIAPYLQYNLSSKIALMVQPAVKYAGVSTRNLDPQSYYNTNDGGNLQQTSTPHTTVHGGGLDTMSWTTVYTYTQSHDSIVKSYKYSGTYMEFELPILLKYSISGKVSVYGGLNMVYCKPNLVSENTYTQDGIVRSVTTGPITTTNYPTSAPDLGFNYTGKPIQDYKDPYPPQQNGQLNAGYMAGVTYNYSKKWLFDALVQQTPISTSGNTIGAPLSNTYFRLSVGYKLTK